MDVLHLLNVIINSSLQIMNKEFVVQMFIHVNIYFVKYASCRNTDSCWKEH